MLPEAPRSIEKGVPLKLIINEKTTECLALNIKYAWAHFPVDDFSKLAASKLSPSSTLSLMERGRHVAQALREFLPAKYAEAIKVLLASLTPADDLAEEFGLSKFFYLPHSFFISDYGLDKGFNEGKDPFKDSMLALYEITTRFTAEFAIRNFLILEEERTLKQIYKWLGDPNPHIRRLCSEGTRPRLPWGKRIPSFIKNPEPTLPLLEALKDDRSLYVRRSVANHLGDIGKDHPALLFSICKGWLKKNPSAELKWLIRHAVRYYAKKGEPQALEIRKAAK